MAQAAAGDPVLQANTQQIQAGPDSGNETLNTGPARVGRPRMEGRTGFGHERGHAAHSQALHCPGAEGKVASAAGSQPSGGKCRLFTRPGSTLSPTQPDLVAAHCPRNIKLKSWGQRPVSLRSEEIRPAAMCFVTSARSKPSGRASPALVHSASTPAYPGIPRRVRNLACGLACASVRRTAAGPVRATVLPVSRAGNGADAASRFQRRSSAASALFLILGTGTATASRVADQGQDGAERDLVRIGAGAGGGAGGDRGGHVVHEQQCPGFLAG